MCCAWLTLTVSAEGGGWYCVRNSEHRQPEFGPDLCWVEEHDSYYLDRRHGDDCADKVLYLTFDAGYENGNVEKILNVLDRKSVV